MLLVSITLVLILVVDNIFASLVILLCLFLINLKKSKERRALFKSLKFVVWFVFLTSITQIIMYREGKILLTILDFPILTNKGLMAAFLVTLRIFNLVMLSKIINYDKLLNGRFSEMKNIITIIIKMIPQVKLFVKQGIKPQKVFNELLKESYKELKKVK